MNAYAVELTASHACTRDVRKVVNFEIAGKRINPFLERNDHSAK
jgi:hypothetical protein